MDILALRERVLRTIELGESQFREFKSALHGAPGAKSPRETSSIAKDISETLVAFANADGGELLVGVEDDGSITGVPHSAERIGVLLAAPKAGVHSETPLASPLTAKLEIDGKIVLFFGVDKGTRYVHQTSDGRCLQRRDRESVPTAATRIQFERNEQISREYDRGFVEGAEVKDLDLDLVKAVSAETSRMSPEKSLQYLGLAEFGVGLLRLRRAALLLFARDVEHWHPRCQVRVVRVRGSEFLTGRDYNVISDETVKGNILQLLTKSWDQLRPHLVETKLAGGALFREQVMYPEDACREALINAITHRDYSVEGKNIEIVIFDDRMEVQSPGALLSTISIDDLRKQQGVHESRNAHIARVLREVGYVREMGEGMRRIFRLMKDADLVAPDVRSDQGRFSVVLFHRSVFSLADQAWLSGYRALRLSREEMLVAMLGKEGKLVSPQAVYDLLGLHDWDIYREVFEQLSTKGLIVNTLSEAQKNKLSKSKGVNRREIARLTVRPPAEIEDALSTLFSAIGKQAPTDHINLKFVTQVVKSLPEDHVYHINPMRLVKLIKLLGLADDDGVPRTSLRELWRQFSAVSPAPVLPAHVTELAPASRLKAPSKVDSVAPDDIYAGNLSYEVTEKALFDLFSTFGQVLRIQLAGDLTTGRGRGFAFVSMADRNAAGEAIRQLNGKAFQNRPLRLNWSRH